MSCYVIHRIPIIFCVGQNHRRGSHSRPADSKKKKKEKKKKKKKKATKWKNLQNQWTQTHTLETFLNAFVKDLAKFCHWNLVMNLWIKTWINEYSKCTFDIFWSTTQNYIEHILSSKHVWQKSQVLLLI